MKYRCNSGFVLVDAIVAMGVAAILTLVFISSIQQSVSGSAHARDQFMVNTASLEMYEIGVALAQTSDGYQAIIDSSCTSVDPCHFVQTGDTWNIVAGQETIFDRIGRSFYYESVTRDTDGQLVSGHGIEDDNTIAFHIIVTWDRKGELFTATTTAYLHNHNSQP